MGRSHNNKRKRSASRPERRLVVRSVRRENPDMPKLAKVLQAFAMAEAEREAQAEHQRRKGGAGSS